MESDAPRDASAFIYPGVMAHSKDPKVHGSTGKIISRNAHEGETIDPPQRVAAHLGVQQRQAAETPAGLTGCRVSPVAGVIGSHLKESFSEVGAPQAETVDDSPPMSTEPRVASFGSPYLHISHGLLHYDRSLVFDLAQPSLLDSNSTIDA